VTHALTLNPTPRATQSSSRWRPESMRWCTSC